MADGTFRFMPLMWLKTAAPCLISDCTCVWSLVAEACSFATPPPSTSHISLVLPHYDWNAPSTFGRVQFRKTILKPTWLNLWFHTISSSLMVNFPPAGAIRWILPTWTLQKDWFGKITQFMISYPVADSPLASKMISSPALLLKWTFFRREWS